MLMALAAELVLVAHISFFHQKQDLIGGLQV